MELTADPSMAVDGPVANRELFNGLLSRSHASIDKVASLELALPPSPMAMMRETHRALYSQDSKKVAQLQEYSQGLLDQVQALRKELSEAKEISVQLEAGSRPSWLESEQKMGNALHHVYERLEQAVAIAGEKVTLVEPKPSHTLREPLERFFDLLANSDAQMEQLYDTVSLLGDDQKSLGTEKLLLLQMNMHQIQERLDFFTAALNQCLSGIKSILQVQV